MTKFEVLNGLQEYGGGDFTVTAVSASPGAFAALAKELGDRCRPITIFDGAELLGGDGKRDGLKVQTTGGPVVVTVRR